MDSRHTFYSDFEEFSEFIDKVLNKKDEDLSPTETITVSALERQKAQLEAQKVKLEQTLKTTLEKMNQLDAQIARMKAT